MSGIAPWTKPTASWTLGCPQKWNRRSRLRLHLHLHLHLRLMEAFESEPWS